MLEIEPTVVRPPNEAQLGIAEVVPPKLQGLGSDAASCPQRPLDLDQDDDAPGASVALALPYRSAARWVFGCDPAQALRPAIP